MTTQGVVEKLGVEVGAFVAKRTAPARLNLARYADDFPSFCREVLGVELWAAQLAMGETVVASPRTVIVSGHSTGKDFWAACFALWWVYCRRGRVLITAASDRQARGIVMALVRRLWVGTDTLGGELFQAELRIDEVAVISAFTSDNSSRLTGYHAERLLVIMSEAQGIEPEAWEAVAACATAPENRVVSYGNPTSPTGPFFQAAHSAQWACLTVPTTAHPNIVSGEMTIAGGPSREWVQFMRDEYGVTSAIYQSRVLALFPSEAIDCLTTRALLEAAFVRHETALNESAAALSRAVVVAWDVSHRGEDSNAVAVVQGGWVRELHLWRAEDIHTSYQRVEDICRLAGDLGTHEQRRAREKARMRGTYRGAGPTLVIDASGMGSVAADALRARGHVPVEFIGSAAPLTALTGGAGRFLNQRAEAYFGFRLAMERGEVALPRSEALVEECLATQWSVTGADKIQILAKEDVRRQLGRSPDTLDAVTMALWGAASEARRPRYGTSKFVG